MGERRRTELAGERGQLGGGGGKDLGDAGGRVPLHDSGLSLSSGGREDGDSAEREGGEGGDGLEQHCARERREMRAES